MAEEQKDTQKLKRVWKNLKDKQENSFHQMHKSKSAGAIADVKVVEKDGQKKVEISTVNGNRIYDDGSKSAEFRAMKPEEKISDSKLEALIRQVLNEGWATTVDNLTPEVVSQLKKACESRGIKTFGVSAEKNEKEQAEKAMKAFKDKQDNDAKKMNEGNRDKDYQAELAAKRLDAERVASEILQAQKRVEASHRRYDNSVQKMKNNIVAAEKKRCEDYLKELREEAFKSFIDDTRNILYGSSKMAEKIVRKKQNGIKLTAEEQRLSDLADKYGLEADSKKDTKSTSEQKKAFALKDLDFEARKSYDEKAKYYRGVRDTKIITLERNAAELELSHMRGDHIEFTEESFRKYAYRYLPMDYTDKKAMAAARKSCLEEIKDAKDEKKAIRRKNEKESDEQMKAIYIQRGLTQDGQVLQVPVKAPSMLNGLHGRIMEQHNVLQEKQKKQQQRSSFSQAVQTKIFAERFGR